MELVKTMALSTNAQFSYTPSEDEVDDYMVRELNLPLSVLRSIEKIPDDKKAIIEAQHNIPALREEAVKGCIARENALDIQKRKTVGDASESGLIKFVQPLMDLGETRKTHPIYSFVNEEGAMTESVIPFNSDIKFNLQIRDLCPEAKNPKKQNEKLVVYMKGAPERIL